MCYVFGTLNVTLPIPFPGDKRAPVRASPGKGDADHLGSVPRDEGL